ncbi:MAG: hypothetical protein B7X57_03695 [Erythrobacter sp. 34-65-8]|nr:MAG: hypothetical protein B7X57_03695 [Erythrobacter sp. 34-65-8]
MKKILLTLAAASLAAGATAAQPGVEISRAVFIERKAAVAPGRMALSLEPATTLKRGDVVVLMLEWTAPGRPDAFVVSSRVPRDLAFRRSGGMNPQVSTDGGKSWGELGTLRIGQRKATPEDVTHLRWHVSDTEAALGRGTMTYSAIVR